MFKFFRHIRQSLINQNKMGKYFKYAIGEIILVVIGILIALQINNWNENRLQNINETKFLNGIHSEFKLNKAYLNNSRNSNSKSLNIGKLLMGFINQDIELLKATNTDSLIFHVFEYGGFEISENAVMEVMQVGQLQKLKNDTLKSLILEWSQKKINVARNRENMTKKSLYLIEYLVDRYPIKNIDMYGILNWEKPSTIKVNKYAIFYDLKFENLLDDYLYNLKQYDNNLKDINKVVDGIIENSTPIYD